MLVLALGGVGPNNPDSWTIETELKTTGSDSTARAKFSVLTLPQASKKVYMTFEASSRAGAAFHLCRDAGPQEVLGHSNTTNALAILTKSRSYCRTIPAPRQSQLTGRTSLLGKKVKSPTPRMAGSTGEKRALRTGRWSAWNFKVGSVKSQRFHCSVPNGA